MIILCGLTLHTGLSFYPLLILKIFIEAALNKVSQYVDVDRVYKSVIFLQEKKVLLEMTDARTATRFTEQVCHRGTS